MHNNKNPYCTYHYLYFLSSRKWIAFVLEKIYIEVCYTSVASTFNVVYYLNIDTHTLHYTKILIFRKKINNGHIYTEYMFYCEMRQEEQLRVLARKYIQGVAKKLCEV